MFNLIETETECLKESIMALGLKTANEFNEDFESDVKQKFNTNRFDRG